MATAFFAVTAAATSAPLNPDYRAEELEFYLSDLKARALIVGSTLDTPARDVARKRASTSLNSVQSPGRGGGLHAFQPLQRPRRQSTIRRCG